jgi:hypothetical protein
MPMSKKIIAVFVVTGVATQQALAYVDDPHQQMIGIPLTAISMTTSDAGHLVLPDTLADIFISFRRLPSRDTERLSANFVIAKIQRSERRQSAPGGSLG